MQLYEWEGQGMLSALSQEFCGLHLHFIHLLFYWHWLGIEETHAKIRLPGKILTKEGNGHWLQGTWSGIPHGAPCPFAGCFRHLSSAEWSLTLVQGWHWVWCRLQTICYDHAGAIFSARSSWSGSDHSKEKWAWTAAVSLHVCLLTPWPKGNQEASEGDSVSTVLPSSAPSVSSFGTFFNIMEHRKSDNRYF